MSPIRLSLCVRSARLTDACVMSLPVCFQAADWTEDELSLLSRLMVKFPGGTPGRWEKIAQDLGRSVTDVKIFKFYFSNQTYTDSNCTVHVHTHTHTHR